jgi:hypothetical protein
VLSRVYKYVSLGNSSNGCALVSIIPVGLVKSHRFFYWSFESCLLLEFSVSVGFRGIYESIICLYSVAFLLLTRISGAIQFS